MGRWLEAGEGLHPPAVLPYEVANVLARLVFDGVLEVEDVTEIWHDIEALGLVLHPFEPGRDGPEVAAVTARLRRQHATDSTYVCLAQRLGTAVWTMNGALARNAADVGLLSSSPADVRGARRPHAGPTGYGMRGGFIVHGMPGPGSAGLGPVAPATSSHSWSELLDSYVVEAGVADKVSDPRGHPPAVQLGRTPSSRRSPGRSRCWSASARLSCPARQYNQAPSATSGRGRREAS